ncbi:sialate O-acetylesterase [Kiritimatiellaeota bacterium B1221]|nr:sialate O-acetylesterase [Kiritimatiellaeota bacterium B1221]
MKKSSLFFVCLLSLSAYLQAELRFATVFGNGAVLQRQQPVAVWGWADPAAKVEVAFSGQQLSTNADASGYWKVMLAPMEANASGQKLAARSGSEQVSVDDILVGEVWIVAGQSNMRAGGPDKPNGVNPFYQTPADAANLPAIRVRNNYPNVSLEPLDDIMPEFRKKTDWVTKDDLSGNLPIPYYFARILRDKLQVPVGLLYLAASGTNQAAWMSKETLESFPGKGSFPNFYEQYLAEKEARLGKSKGAIQSWEDFLKAQDEWFESQNGRWPGRGMTYVNYPTALYNGRVHPFAPYGVKGVIWHQGEAGPGGPYDQRLVAMFRQWRELYGQDFYAIWGTLSKHTKSQPPLNPAISGFYRSGTNGHLRRALTLFEGDPKVEYVELYDLGNDDTHFTQKAESGRRMALAALDIAYGQPQTYTGPRIADSKFEGGKVFLKFDHVGEGLVYRPSINGISGFFVQDDQGQSRWANVEVLSKDSIVLSHPDLNNIAYVAGGAASNPHETLLNSDGIPLSTFSLNPGKVRTGKVDQPVELVKFESNPGGKINLHFSHAQQEGYMFELRERRAPKGKTATMKVYVPSEWQGVEVVQQGSALPLEAVVEGENRFLKIEVAVNGGQVTVAEKGKLELFKGIDRY